MGSDGDDDNSIFVSLSKFNMFILGLCDKIVKLWDIRMLVRV